eukprot:scaffold626_cov409-Prasinococcus_capsulatus_cf.AAC.10
MKTRLLTCGLGPLASAAAREPTTEACPWPCLTPKAETDCIEEWSLVGISYNVQRLACFNHVAPPMRRATWPRERPQTPAASWPGGGPVQPPWEVLATAAAGIISGAAERAVASTDHVARANVGRSLESSHLWWAGERARETFVPGPNAARDGEARAGRVRSRGWRPASFPQLSATCGVRSALFGRRLVG